MKTVEYEDLEIDNHRGALDAILDALVIPLTDFMTEKGIRNEVNPAQARAKQRIKDLFLEIIGEDIEPHWMRDEGRQGIEATIINNHNAGVRRKIESL